MSAKDPFIWMAGMSCYRCVAIAATNNASRLSDVGFYEGYNGNGKTTTPCTVCGHVAPAKIRRSQLPAYRMAEVEMARSKSIVDCGHFVEQRHFGYAKK